MRVCSSVVCIVFDLPVHMLYEYLKLNLHIYRYNTRIELSVYCFVNLVLQDDR